MQTTFISESLTVKVNPSVRMLGWAQVGSRRSRTHCDHCYTKQEKYGKKKEKQTFKETVSIMPHQPQCPKWPPGGFKMSSRVWKGFYLKVIGLSKFLWKYLIGRDWAILASSLKVSVGCHFQRAHTDVQLRGSAQVFWKWQYNGISR